MSTSTSPKFRRSMRPKNLDPDADHPHIPVVRLSSLQYTMLKAFTTERENFTMTIEQAGQFDQRPFASMLKRKYVRYDRVREGFFLTSEGKEAMAHFETANVFRRYASLNLTKLFILPRSLRRVS